MEPVYRILANQIEADILAGRYVAEGRLPSIHRLATSRKLSIATIQNAYELLERKRLIYARHKSGYYVAASVSAEPPPVLKYEPVPIRVSIGKLAMRMYADSLMEGNRVNLGGASFPDTSFPAVKQIYSLFAKKARSYTGSGYVNSSGLAQLKTAVSRHLAKTGIGAGADEIVITAGCQEALNLSLKAVAKPGDLIAVESPTYFGILQLIESSGMQALEIPSDPATGINLGALRLALEKWPVAACIVIPSFSNPTGGCMGEAARRELCDLANKYNLPIIEDDVYGELSFSELRPQPLKRWDRTGNILLCSSISKSINPGLRTGWVAAGRFHEAVSHLKLLHSVCADPIAQLTLAEFIDSGAFDRHLRQIRSIYKHRRDKIVDLVHKYFPTGIRLSVPEGGIFMWLELPETIDTVSLYDQALAAGIVISPGTLFSASGKFRNAMRLNFAHEVTRKTEQAYKTLATLIQNQQDK